MKKFTQWRGLYGNQPTISGKINDNEPVSSARSGHTTQRSRAQFAIRNSQFAIL